MVQLIETICPSFSERFKAFNIDQEDRLSIGSLNSIECEVVGYKCACRATLATTWIAVCLSHCDGGLYEMSLCSKCP